MSVRTILHVDMDAFYASVEERERPELVGKPLIVGGVRGRGVVAAANYAVRRFGVRSAMPMGEALRRCPQAICVAPRMTLYRDVSAQVFAVFREFTPLVEGLSLDEAFLDLTGSERLLGSAEAVAAEIRRRIRSATQLSASVGLATNKLLAKIASDLAKPDGLCRIDAANLRSVLDPLPIERLFGIGPRTLERVHAAGIRSVGDAAGADQHTLWRAFGKHGAAMRARALGLDDRPVVAAREEKSLSAEETFSLDVRDPKELGRRLVALADRAAARLRAHGLVAARVTVKIRRADFATYTRQRRLEPPSQASGAVRAAALELLTDWLRAQPDAALRLLGVAAGELHAVRQQDLFVEGSARAARLDATIDDIRDRFGAGLVTRASLLPSPRGV